MRNTAKRTLVLAVVVCMLLSVLPFAAFAAEAPAYSWSAAEYFKATSTFIDADGKIPEINPLYGQSNFNFTTKYTDPNHASYAGAGNEYLVYTVNNSTNGSKHSYTGIQFNTVAAGEYTVTIDTKSVGDNVTLTIHIASGADFADCTNTSSTVAKIASLISEDSKKVATINLAKDKSNPEDIVFKANMPEKPIIIISGPETGNSKTAIQFTNVSFVKEGGSSDPEPTTPNATEPGATEPQASKPAATQPNTNNTDNADNGGFPVVAVVIIAVVVIGGAAAAFLFLKKKK